MSKFIEVHVLQRVGANGGNRDDIGLPKTMIYGEKDARYRFSSQALTRSVKNMIHSFYEGKDINDYNSREFVQYLSNILKVNYGFSKENGFSEEDIDKISAKHLKDVFGISIKNDKKNNTSRTETANLIALYEIDIIASKIKEEYDKLGDINKVKIADKDVKNKFKGGINSVLFGRMFASNPKFDVNATVQRSHSTTTHSVKLYDNRDIFVTTEELIKNSLAEGNGGASHKDERVLAHGFFYKCWIICVDEMMDNEHLGNLESTSFDKKDFLKQFIMYICLALPEGQKNTILCQTSPSFVLMNVVNSSLPLSYDSAFFPPIQNDDNCTQNSINSLLNKFNDNKQWSNYDLSATWVGCEGKVEGEYEDITHYKDIKKLVSDITEKSVE